MKRLLVLVVPFAVSLTGCFLFGTTSPATDGAVDANAQASLQANLEQVRAQAKTGDTQAQVMYAATLLGVLGNTDAKAAYGELDWDAMVAEAEAMLAEQAASTDEVTAMQATALRAEIQAVTGRGPAAVETWETAHAARPSFSTAVGVLLISQTTGIALADPAGFCGDNRGLVEGEVQLYQYMQICYSVNPVGTMAEALPWAKDADFASYAAVDAQVQAEAAAREAEWQAEQAEFAQRMDEADAASDSNSSSNSSSSASAPAGPSSVSVTLKNNCKQTVKLFFGDKPKFGSGTYSSLGSNTQTSMSFRPGDMIWIVDDSQNGISSTSVSASTNRVEITESCSGLTAR